MTLLMMSEENLQELVSNYLRDSYPGVVFHNDFGSGAKLTKSQAARQARLNNGMRGWPDLFIAKSKPRTFGKIHGMPITNLYKNIGGKVYDVTPCNYHGLFLELKKEGTRLKKKNGEWATEHIAEQAEMLEKLRQAGFVAEFAVGFDEAKKIIDEYLSRGV